MFRDFTKYEVYPNGKIWSYSQKKFLKPVINHNGYQRVHLSDNEGKRKYYFVHRVVWESITGYPIPEGMQVNHIDECKTNNHINNLNLMTCKENINFGSGIKRSAKARINGKSSKQVGAFQNCELVMTFQSVNEAGRNGFNKGAVAACCRNCYNREGNNVYKGLTWKYI